MQERNIGVYEIFSDDVLQEIVSFWPWSPTNLLNKFFRKIAIASLPLDKKHNILVFAAQHGMTYLLNTVLVGHCTTVHDNFRTIPTWIQVVERTNVS
jgi:hypothetical protein